MSCWQKILLLTLLIGVSLLYPLLAPTPHRIDESHFSLVRVGMTEADVEAIFGVPAGSYDWAVEEEDATFALFALVDWGIDQKISVNINHDGFIASFAGPRKGKLWTLLSGPPNDANLVVHTDE
jgi:hypothetical protein